MLVLFWDIFKLELDNMVKSGIFVKVVELILWVFSFVIVKKFNGKIWVCLDFWDFNCVVKCLYYLFLIIEEVVICFSGVKVFSVLDVKCGFW